MPLVGFDGHVFKPAGFTDNVGIYYIVPRIATWLGLDLGGSIDAFLGGMVLLSLAVGMVGAFLLYRRWSVRCVAFLMLAGVSLIAWCVGNVYIVYSSAVIAIVPWCVYLYRGGSGSPGHVLVGFAAGIVIGVANFLRSHSGTAVFIFLLPLILSYPRADRTKKALLVAVVLLGILLSSMPFRLAVRERDRFLAQNAPGYGDVAARHPFWHSVYIGFGYLSNEYGIRYEDEVAARKVREISPKAGYVSAEYEKILRGEIFRLTLRHPLFVLRTVFAKAGVLFLFFLIFANLGFLFRKRFPQDRAVENSFFAALAFSALPGILVIPQPGYILGYIAFAALYGINGVERIIEGGIDWQRSWHVAGDGGKVDFNEFAGEYKGIQDEHLRFFGEESGYFADIKASMVRDLVIPAPRRILEFGCGTGMNLGSLAVSFPEAELSGCDISEESLRVAANRHPGVDLFVSDRDGDKGREPFDLVFVANVFHHIVPAERGPILEDLRRRMAAGGSLVVFEHNPYNPVTRHLVSTCPFDRDAVLLAPRELKSLVAGAGLRVRSLRYVLFFPASLRRLRFLEKSMGFLPLGGQYCIHATSG